MSTRKLPDGRWYVCARVRVGGKLRTRERTLATTKEGARALDERFKAELRGQFSDSLRDGASTFGEVMRLYQEKRPSESAAHRSRCGLLERELGKAPLAGFAERLETWLGVVKRTPTVRGTLPSPTTINRLVEIVRASFNVAVACGAVAGNPVTAARFPKARELPRYVTLDGEAELRLMRAIDEHAPYLRPLVEYLLLVPSRKGELTRARREQVNLLAGTLFIPAGDTKAKQALTKPIPPVMRGYFESIPAECPWVFYRQDGAGRFRPLGDFRKAWATCTKAAGLAGFRVHDCRHVAASRLANRGVPTVAINAVAGWRTDMLARYYGETPWRLLAMLEYPGQEAFTKPSQGLHSCVENCGKVGGAAA